MKKVTLLFIIALTCFLPISTIIGQTWEQLAIPYQGNLNVIGIHIVDNQKLIIEYNRGPLYTSNNLGISWTEISLGAGCAPQVQRWSFYDGLNGFLSYNCGTSTSQILKTNDGGNSWNLMTCNVQPRVPFCNAGDQFGNLTKVYFTGPMNGFALSNWGEILTTGDAGTTWQTMCLDISNSNPPGVLFHFNEIELSGNKGFLLASDASGAGAWIFRTNNGGTAWADWTTFAGGLKGRYYHKVYFHGTNSVFICGEAGKLIRSFDGGTTFDTLTTSPAGSLYNIKFFDTQHGMIVGAGVGNTQLTFRSDDGGHSWYQANVPAYDHPFYCIEQGLDGTVYLGGELSPQEGYIFKSKLFNGISNINQNTIMKIYRVNDNTIAVDPIAGLKEQTVKAEVFSVDGKMLYSGQISWGQPSVPARISLGFPISGLIIVKLTGRDFCLSEKVIF